MKNILVTGASTGIGEALCEALIDQGNAVYGSVRKEADAERLVEKFGESFKPLIFDVTDNEAIKAAATIVSTNAGHLDVLVNNAGIAVGGPLLYIDLKDFEYQFEVNVLGMMKVIQAFAPLLGARDNHGRAPGRIIQISSVSGEIGMPFVGPYVSSKHAVEGLSKSLRKELMMFGIDVIVIGPGAVQTPIWKKGGEQIKKWEKTPYAESLSIFNRQMRKIVDQAIPVENLAADITKIISSKKPKPRYTFASDKFKSWTIPRLLPTRFFDKMVAKALKLMQKES